MEFMSNLGGGLQADRPSLFELIAQDKMREMLEPALRYVIAVRNSSARFFLDRAELILPRSRSGTEGNGINWTYHFFLFVDGLSRCYLGLRSTIPSLSHPDREPIRRVLCALDVFRRTPLSQ
jgi:hypothetical protein